MLNKISYLSLCCIAVMAGNGYVQAEPASQTRDIQLGEGIELYPQATVELGHDDNLLLSDGNEMSSGFATLAASGKIVARKSQNATYHLQSGLKNGTYFDSADDNYLDGQLQAGGDWTVSRRVGLKVQAEYDRGHDARGGVDRGLGTEPDTWNNTGVKGTFRYGREEARGRIEVDAAYHTKRYDQFSLTEKTEDKNTAEIGAAFFHRLQPKTEVFVEGRYANTDFRLDTSTRDNQAYHLRGGVIWNATAKTTGIAKLGYTSKKFDAAGMEDFSGLDWRLEARWQPVERDRFDVYTARHADDSTGLGNYNLATDYGVSWNHDWTPRIHSSLKTMYSDLEYGGYQRDDKSWNYSLGLEYAYAQWLKFGGEASFSKRDSSVIAKDYDRSILFMYAKIEY